MGGDYLDKEGILKKFFNLGMEIIRLKPDGKNPAEKWKEPRKRSLDEVKGLLKYGANFGGVCGDRSGGIVVIDLDQPELYHKYFSKVKTLVVKTPKKGYHLYLKTPKDQETIHSYLFKPLDIQGNKAYVVIPPSSINGKEYEIIKDEPLIDVKDPVAFVDAHLKDITFKKTVDCRDLAKKELGPPENDFGQYTQYLCPFHTDSDTPSLTVYQDGFKCFGCQWSGSAQDFLLKIGKKSDEVFDYLDKHGVDLSEDEIKLQTKRQKQLQMLCGLIKNKYPLVTDVTTHKHYVYFPPKNVWMEINNDGFFKQLVYEETGHPILDDELDILVQYIFNPQKEDSDWVGFDNGMVNVETGEFLPPTESIFTTTHLNFKYNPDAYSELYEQVLKDILCDDVDGCEKYHFFFEMVGYFFTGHNFHNKMFFITGSGANGKSTLMLLIRRIFSNYTCSQQLQNLHKDFGLQPLIGKKINIVYDLSNKALTDIGTLKAITGEDEVTINIKNKPQISLKLPTKIVATGNVLPKVDEETYAFYRRVVHLELKNTFKNPNTNLHRELMDDTNGLEWLIYKSIQSYMKVKENGWSIKEDIENVTESYKKLSDPLNWVASKLFEPGDDDDFITSDNVYEAMRSELEKNEMVIPQRNRKYYEYIREIGGESVRKRIEDKQKRVWVGVRFKLPDELVELKGWV